MHQEGTQGHVRFPQRSLKMTKAFSWENRPQGNDEAFRFLESARKLFGNMDFFLMFKPGLCPESILDAAPASYDDCDGIVVQSVGAGFDFAEDKLAVCDYATHCVFNPNTHAPAYFLSSLYHA